MKRAAALLLVLFVTAIATHEISAQKIRPPELITSSDLESYVTFLASPLLKGRLNGGEGLEIAARYIESQARLLNLKPANGGSYLQPYIITSKTPDPEKTSISVISGSDTVYMRESFYNLIPQGPSDFSIGGEVVFAGYGIKSDKYSYNDLGNIETEGKILLVMSRAPIGSDGKTPVFTEKEWNSEMSLQLKLGALFSSKPKAILFVPDPKSGHHSLDDSSPGFTGFLSNKNSLKGKEEMVSPLMGMLPKVIFINRKVADAILKDTGKSLEELQNEIDGSLKPRSFIVPGKKINITAASLGGEKTLHNVAALIEGSDPLLKNEIVIFSAHYDHIGGSGDRINTGADDDASGCAALLSIAEAFQSLPKKPLRSILFLWVSGEEIGLFGSESYINAPLFPLEKTVADLNMDMIGRIKTEADSTSGTPMTGPDGVFVITDGQSKDLRAIADAVDKKSQLNFDYSLSGRDHPLQLFARSDHYNFVMKDIPVLFFTTGLHADYHTPRDVVERIDFVKMQSVARTMYEIGFMVANRKERIVVDNPFSSWGKSK